MPSTSGSIPLNQGDIITIEVNGILTTVTVPVDPPLSTAKDIRIRAKVFLEGPLQ